MFIKRVIQAFNQAKIPYSIVGGYAVVLHGVLRGTIDIDLVTELSLKNLKKVEATLNKMGLQGRIPVTADDIYNFKDEYIKNKNLVAWSFVNGLNPTEVVDVLITSDLKSIKSIELKLENLKIQVIDKKSLIKMKRSAGRPQDLEDVKALEKLI